MLDAEEYWTNKTSIRSAGATKLKLLFGVFNLGFVWEFEGEGKERL